MIQALRYEERAGDPPPANHEDVLFPPMEVRPAPSARVRSGFRAELSSLKPDFHLLLVSVTDLTAGQTVTGRARCPIVTEAELRGLMRQG